MNLQWFNVIDHSANRLGSHFSSIFGSQRLFRGVKNVRKRSTKTVFISHSKKDAELVEIINHNFRSVGVTPLFMEFTPESEPPHKKIEERVKLSSAVFLFLTQNVFSSEYTKNWISFEVGLAKANNKPVYVMEDLNNKVNFPIPYLTDYVLYEPTNVESWTDLQKIVGKLKQTLEDKNRLLLGLAGGAILGGLADSQDQVRGAILGGIGGAVLGGILNALTSTTSVDFTRTKCTKCGIEFNLHSKVRQFPCPSCRTELSP